MKVISGGQTGVDRAALDAAQALGMPCGGFCPRGRRAEDGRVSERYPLVELASSAYAARTRANVEAADATLVLVQAKPTGGTKLTIQWCQRLNKPHLVLSPLEDQAFQKARNWLAAVRPDVLNVAGPRESQWHGGYQVAFDFLVRLFQSLRDSCPETTREARDNEGRQSSAAAGKFQGGTP